MRRYLLSLLLFSSFLGASSALSAKTPSEVFSQAMSLYEKGLYYEAFENFSQIAQEREDINAEGYAVLCRVTLRSKGYEVCMNNFLAEYPALPVSNRIIFRYALNCFDDENYKEALQYFNKLQLKKIESSMYSEYVFKKAYCSFELGDYDAAIEGFGWTLELPRSDYHAPARYALGYMTYQKNEFQKAYDYFSVAKSDSRFASNSRYYMMECRFMLGDYDYVIEHADEAFKTIPEDRKPRLARMVSEIYLVWQEPEKAQLYYDRYLVKEEPKTRKDFFHAGSLLYAVSDYEGAVEKFAGMKYRGDSLGQIANYQMANSYIQLKNKVAAMQAFKEASAVNFDAKMTEDAFFNYAKLAFDLNKDGSGFKAYLQRYSDTHRGEQIYSYMALAYLQDREYDLAIEYYDKVEDLDEAMQSNYMKANYLLGAQLLEGDAYRSAADHFRWASVYAGKGSQFAQFSNYYLASAYYRDAKYEKARKIYTDLYNMSALNGTDYQPMIEYSLAYCYFKEGNYEMADRWFSRYARNNQVPYRKNAIVRRGDCSFLRADYTTALAHYTDAFSAYADSNDIYPYYQAGLCYGLLADKNGRITTLQKVKEASEEAPYYSEAMYELGRAYVDADRVNGAKETFKTLVAKAKDSNYVAKALLALGMLSRNEGNLDSALVYYKKVVETMPVSESANDAVVALEGVYQELGEPAVYLAYLEQIGRGDSKTEEEKERIVFNAAEQIFLAGNWERSIVSLSEFKQAYPESVLNAKADFYMAESYKNRGEKELARDYYSSVVESSDTSFLEISILNFAKLSYAMQKYDDAYCSYRVLMATAKFDENKKAAREGLMYAAYWAKRYEEAISASDVLISQKAEAALQEDARYIKAKSLLMLSRRDESMVLFKQLAMKPKTAKGAESVYMLIQDAFDRADYDMVLDMTADFSDSGTTHVYYLAKSILLLCDAYVERGDLTSAKENLEWVKDTYRSSDPSDDIQDAVRDRLEKLASKKQ
jgi:tetratricopeptide (TPR) repeat protein